MDRNEISNDGFLVWPSNLVLAPLKEVVSHARRTLLTLTHNAGVKLGAVPSTDSDFENGGSTSKSANTTKPMHVACKKYQIRLFCNGIGPPYFGALMFGFPGKGKKALPLSSCDPRFGVFASLCVQHRRTAFASCDLQTRKHAVTRLETSEVTSFRGDHFFLARDRASRINGGGRSRWRLLFRCWEA